MEKVRALIHWFDLYGKPIMPLNIKGHSTFTTTVGGLTGILVAGLMIQFL